MMRFVIVSTIKVFWNINSAFVICIIKNYYLIGCFIFGICHTIDSERTPQLVFQSTSDLLREEGKTKQI